MRPIKSTFALSFLLSSVALVFEGAVTAQTTAQITSEKLAVVNHSKNQFGSGPTSTPSSADPEEDSSSAGRNPVVEPDPATDTAATETNLPRPLPLRVQGKPNDLERAYLDAYSILLEETKCSSFLGGRRSIEALNELVKQLRPTYLKSDIAVRMTGPITTYQNNRTGVSFRLFSKAELNLDGSFYRSRSSFNPHVPWVGDFAPNTREARVTVLLHELGHLVQGADKLWVLPDDGLDPSLSRENTRRILDTCGKRIQEISRLPFREQD